MHLLCNTLFHATCTKRVLKLALCHVKTFKKLSKTSETISGSSDVNKSKSRIVVNLQSLLPQHRDLNRCYLSSHLSTCLNKKPTMVLEAREGEYTCQYCN